MSAEKEIVSTSKANNYNNESMLQKVCKIIKSAWNCTLCEEHTLNTQFEEETTQAFFEIEENSYSRSAYSNNSTRSSVLLASHSINANCNVSITQPTPYEDINQPSTSGLVKIYPPSPTVSEYMKMLEDSSDEEAGDNIRLQSLINPRLFFANCHINLEDNASSNEEVNTME